MSDNFNRGAGPKGFNQHPVLNDTLFLTIKAMNKSEMEVFLNEVRKAKHWQEVEQYIRHESMLMQARANGK